MISASRREIAAFRSLCRDHGVAATHQRQAVYDCITTAADHPSPELVWERVRVAVPTISLGTVYKCIHTFLEWGVIQEASLHHGSLRIDPNVQPHHHLFCRACGSISDLSLSAISPPHINHKLPAGFRVERTAVELIGVCAVCSVKAT